MQIPYEEELCALADAVWETPEPGFREYKSSAAHVEFLKKHGFAFGVQSEEGKGSTFWFEMNVSKQKKHRHDIKQ